MVYVRMINIIARTHPFDDIPGNTHIHAHAHTFIHKRTANPGTDIRYRLGPPLEEEEVRRPVPHHLSLLLLVLSLFGSGGGAVS